MDERSLESMIELKMKKERRKEGKNEEEVPPL